MEKALFILRIFAIIVLGMVATIGIFGCPDENLPFTSWFLVFLVSKMIGFAALFGVIVLCVGYDCAKQFMKGIINDELEPEHKNH